MNNIESKLFDLYKQWINDGNCKNCQQYDSKLPSLQERIGPVSFFHAGKNMANHNKSPRIVFVGKVSWNSKKDVKDDTQINGFLNLSNVGEGYYNDESSTPSYWNFIRKITKELNLLLDDIAITNLVKCNISDNEKETSDDITHDFYYKQCVPLFEKEIIALNPTHLILFTNTSYDHLLQILTMKITRNR
jgi:uracil-DNA glycosylase